MFVKCFVLSNGEVVGSPEMWVNTDQIVHVSDYKDYKNVKTIDGNLYRVSEPVIRKDLIDTLL